MPIQVQLNFPLDALNIIAELASKQCQGSFYHTATRRVQACTMTNPCLVCRARSVDQELGALSCPNP